MAFDTNRIDGAVLTLLYLGLHDDLRAWKGLDWAAMNRLHAKGMIESRRRVPLGHSPTTVTSGVRVQTH